VGWFLSSSAKALRTVFRFQISDFGFVSNFDIRISDFLATTFWFWLRQVRISGLFPNLA
jgi:hypothetical protein